MILLLILIYLAFISLGLPDSILGTALPSLLSEAGLPLSAGSLLSTVIMSSTIISSFFSVHVIRKLGTGVTVWLSCLMTGTVLLGFSMASSFWYLLILGIPLGLGGGAVDAALNNFVAVHYKAHHMNWLHSFWGLGATLGPVVMSFSLAAHDSWRPGYSSISIIQLTLAALLLVSLPLWKRAGEDFSTAKNGGSNSEPGKTQNVWKIKGVYTAFGIMMLYCTVEAAIGLWGSSYLVGVRDFTAEQAASLIAFYFGGITAGRFLSGFISFRMTNSQMIRTGLVITGLGAAGLSFFTSPVLTAFFIVLTGFGLAPVFPAMLHETPARFGKESSQVLIGYQMGFAYIGSAFLSPGIGIVLQISDVALLPFILLFTVALLIILSEILNRRTERTHEQY